MLDRDTERAMLDELVEAARAGRGGAIVLSGELGLGLTTLLNYGAGAAAGMKVVRTSGTEPERHLAYAGVHALCVSMLDRLEEVPGAQREALAAAMGLAGRIAPDPFLLGLGVLNLLAKEAEERPLFCAVDDAQWLDRPSADALAFVARRLDGAAIAMAFALHEPAGPGKLFAGIPRRCVGPLPRDAAFELLSSRVEGPFDGSVRDRLMAEAMGVPLALVELPAQLSAGQLAGLSALPSVLPVGRRMQERLLSGMPELPPSTRTLLLLAAAEPDAPASLLWSAAAVLGVPPDAAAPAEAEGLLRVRDRLEFSHRLVRLAIYESAPVSERQRAHKALAQVIDPVSGSERRTWHRAAASLTADEEVAAELDGLGARAKDRGDSLGAAALFEQAASLTPDLTARLRRTLAAAQAAVAGGALNWATSLLDRTGTASLDELGRAQADRLRGAIALALGQGTDRITALLRAANAFQPLDLQLGRDTYLEALEAAIYAGRFGAETSLVSVAEAALCAAPAGRSRTCASDMLLNGLALLVTADHETAAVAVREATEALRGADQVRWFELAALAALEVWDDAALHDLASRQVELGRGGGAPPSQFGLGRLLDIDNVIAGRFGAVSSPLASPRATEAPASSSEAPFVPPAEVLAAAWRGLPTEARDLAETYMRQAFVHESGLHVAIAQHATAVLEISLGRYEAALSSARQACEETSVYVVAATLPDLVEAAVRAGERELAVSAAGRLSQRAQASGTDWALGVQARSLALVDGGQEADGLYQKAIEHLRRSRAAPQLARAHLVYGEWLRRERRRREAREHLRTARDMFVFMGANAFAERARSELAATGEHLGPPADAPESSLTVQEGQIARLAGEGASNAEIAGQLFLSPRTVEYHLHKVFRKLGVSSRTQLARAVLGHPLPEIHGPSPRGD